MGFFTLGLLPVLEPVAPTGPDGYIKKLIFWVLILKRYKMSSYNAKINMKGKYLPFYGWSTIGLVDNSSEGFNGTLGLVENFIKNDVVLKKYFSALPTESYHVTVCNIWCNGSPLLAHQKRFLKDNYINAAVDVFTKQSQQRGLFNPDWCINELLKKIGAFGSASRGSAVHTRSASMQHSHSRPTRHPAAA